MQGQKEPGSKRTKSKTPRITGRRRRRSEAGVAVDQDAPAAQRQRTEAETVSAAAASNPIHVAVSAPAPAAAPVSMPITRPAMVLAPIRMPRLPVNADIAVNRELIDAIRTKDFARVRVAIHNGANPNAYIYDGREGASAIHAAAQAGDVAILDYLLDEGANIDAGARLKYEGRPIMDGFLKGVFGNAYFHDEARGGTALHYAVVYNKPHIVRRLIERGINVYTYNHQMLYPRDIAQRWNPYLVEVIETAQRERIARKPRACILM